MGPRLRHAVQIMPQCREPPKKRSLSVNPRKLEMCGCRYLRGHKRSVHKQCTNIFIYLISLVNLLFYFNSKQKTGQGMEHNSKYEIYKSEHCRMCTYMLFATHILCVCVCVCESALGWWGKGSRKGGIADYGQVLGRREKRSE